MNDFDDRDGSSASNGDGKLYGIIKSQNNGNMPEISGIFLSLGYTCAIAGSNLLLL
jgi:hypothetical protein